MQAYVSLFKFSIWHYPFNRCLLKAKDLLLRMVRRIAFGQGFFMSMVFALIFALVALLLGSLFLVGAWVCVCWLYQKLSKRSAAHTTEEAFLPQADSSAELPPPVALAVANDAAEDKKRESPAQECAVTENRSDIAAEVKEKAVSLLPTSLPDPGSALRSPLIRFSIVAVIAVVLLLPLALVEDMVKERSSLYREVTRDIGRTWGGSQHFVGPVLLIPYTERQLTSRRVRNEDSNSRQGTEYTTVTESHMVLNYLVVLPATLDFKGSFEPQERRRGIYRTLVYSADIDVAGRFVLPSADALERVAPTLVEVDYAKSFIVMGLSYPNALREAGAFVWNGVPLRAEPGTQPFSALKSGFRVPVSLERGIREYAFSQKLGLNGSQGIRFTPVGETTGITLSSSWPHPSFQGAVLPMTRDVSADGFTATWSIPSLARSYPNLGTEQAWPESFKDFSAGVDFYEAATHYHLVQRSVKYGILFIGLTFLAFLIFELGLNDRLHPVQHGLVGLAMVIFYLVLLSLSEHFSFFASYSAAAACMIAMIAAYSGVAMRSPRRGAGIAALLGALYTLLYAILQMEDYALLMGTALILVMLGVLMAVSRNMAVAGK